MKQGLREAWINTHMIIKSKNAGNTKDIDETWFKACMDWHIRELDQNRQGKTGMTLIKQELRHVRIIIYENKIIVLENSHKSDKKKGHVKANIYENKITLLENRQNSDKNNSICE